MAASLARHPWGRSRAITPSMNDREVTTQVD
jgi:hypothetical protein